MANANAKIAVVLVALVGLLQVSSAVARHHHHGKPGPCDAAAEAADFVNDDLRDKKTTPHRPGSHRCPPARHGGHGGGGTPAVMTVNGFRRGESGGGPSACDGRFHGDGELVAALSKRWFAGGRRCHRAIRIASARTGRSVEARAVDECDSRRGCRGDVVDSSPAVWRALGLDTGVGEVPVTWSDA